MWDTLAPLALDALNNADAAESAAVNPSSSAGPATSGTVTGSHVSVTGSQFGAWPFGGSTPGLQPGQVASVTLSPKTGAGFSLGPQALAMGAAALALLLVLRKRGRR